ncbi:hypothetical protein GW17_00044401 [Ensete ventricosum]|nr:hypothetical protein GW17_00044401 [Ensete ventricosum]
MGNKMGRRRQVVDEKYTRPQGLYVLKDIDHKKLRKLILESKLAPCYPGLEDYSFALEECPICFLEQGSQGVPGCGGSTLPGPSTSGEWYNLPRTTAPAKLSSSGGLACAAAALAERQHMNSDAAAHVTANSAAAVLPDGGSELPREEFGEFSTDRWSEVAEAGTSYAGSDGMVEAGAAAIPLPEGTNVASGFSVPESFDEQMMLAMAVSLAEAQARTSSHGVSWQ